MPGSPTRRRSWGWLEEAAVSKAASNCASSRPLPTNGVSAAPAVRKPVRLLDLLGQPGRDGFLLTFQSERRQLFVGDRLPGELAGERTDHDAAGRGGGLKAGGGVDGVTGEEGLTGGGGDVGVQVGLARVDADAHLDGVAVGPGERGGLGRELEGAAHGPLGVVVVGGREAEDGEHGVADELLDDAAVALDEPLRQGAVALQQGVDKLVVCGLGVRCVADEVAEQSGDDLALLGEGARLLERSFIRGQPGAAGRAEGELIGVLAGTRGTGGHRSRPMSRATPDPRQRIQPSFGTGAAILLRTTGVQKVEECSPCVHGTSTDGGHETSSLSAPSRDLRL